MANFLPLVRTFLNHGWAADWISMATFAIQPILISDFSHLRMCTIWPLADRYARRGVTPSPGAKRRIGMRNGELLLIGGLGITTPRTSEKWSPVPRDSCDDDSLAG